MEQRLPTWLLAWKRWRWRGGASAATPTRRQHLVRRGGLCGAGLLAFALLLPTLVSWGPGASLVGGIASWAIPGQIHLDGISCGWFSQLTVTGLKISTPQGEPVIALKQARVSRGGLLRLALGERALGEVAVVGLRVNLEQYADGSTNLERALGPSDPDAPSIIPPSLQAVVALRDAELQVRGPSAAPVSVRYTADAVIDGGRSLVGSLDATLWHGEAAGRVQVALELSDFAGADGQPQLHHLRLDARTEVTDLALSALETLVGSDAVVSPHLGPVLNGTGELSVQPRASAGTTNTASGPTWTINGHTEWTTDRLQLQGELAGTLRPTALHLTPTTSLQLDIEPALIASLVGPANEAPLALLAPVAVNLHLKRTDLAWHDGFAIDADARLDLHMRRKPGEPVASGQLETHGVAVAATLRLPDGRLPLRSWRDSELELLLNAESIEAYYEGKRVPIERSLMQFSLGDRVARLEHFSLDAMHGNITLAGQTSLADERFESTYQLRLLDLDANSAIALAYPPDTLAGRTQGTINGEIHLHGPLATITEEADGGGEIEVTDGVLAPLPVISDILQLLRVGNLLQKAGRDLHRANQPAQGDDTARAVFDFVGDHAHFRTIDVVTRLVRITGEGDVGFDESLDLKLVAELLAGWVKRPITVTGTIHDPVIDPFGSTPD